MYLDDFPYKLGMEPGLFPSVPWHAAQDIDNNVALSGPPIAKFGKSQMDIIAIEKNIFFIFSSSMYCWTNFNLKNNKAIYKKNLNQHIFIY